MVKNLSCPNCGHRQSYQLQKPDKGDPYPPPEIVACGNDEGGCFGYFASTYAGQVFTLESKLKVGIMKDFAKIVRTEKGEQVLRYIEQAEQKGVYRVVGMVRYPGIDFNHASLWEGSLAECEAQLQVFDQNAATRELARHM